jgi:hypothetical protein
MISISIRNPRAAPGCGVGVGYWTIRFLTGAARNRINGFPHGQAVRLLVRAILAFGIALSLPSWLSVASSLPPDIVGLARRAASAVVKSPARRIG